MKLLFYLASLFTLQSATAQHKRLFLAAGQSNAVGMGDSTQSVLPGAGKAFEYRFSGDSLKALKDPVGNYELHLEKAIKGSLWPAFADEYNRLTDKTVIIVPAAKGGSSCHSKAELENYGTWDTIGRTRIFDSAIIKTKAAIKKSRVKLNGIIWSQGERDANAINAKQLTAAEYKASLKKLIERFRKVFDKNLGFYIIQTGYYVNHPRDGYDEVRKAQEEVAMEMKNVYLVYNQTGGFADKGLMKDEIHYNQQALNEIGKEVAKEIIQAEKK